MSDGGTHHWRGWLHRFDHAPRGERLVQRSLLEATHPLIRASSLMRHPFPPEGESLERSLALQRDTAGMRGFTLIELLVTIAILAIAMGLAIPGFQALMASGQRSESASELYVSMLQARSEAVARNTTIALVPLDGDWSNGWQVIVDENGDDVPDAIDVLGDGTLDADAGVLAEVAFANQPPQWQVDPVGLSRIRFNRSGRILAETTMTLCGPDARRSREVSGTPAGQIRLRDLGADAVTFSARCG